MNSNDNIISRNRKIAIVAGITITITTVIILFFGVFAGVKRASNNKKLQEATDAISKTNSSVKDTETGIFAQEGNCMVVASVRKKSNSTTSQSQPEYYVVCEESGKQHIKLGPASSFQVRDLILANVPIKLQAKLTGLSESELNNQRQEFYSGSMLASQVNNDIIGSPIISGQNILSSAGLDIDNSTLNDIIAKIGWHFANINIGKANNSTPPPDKQIYRVEFKNAKSNIDLNNLNRTVYTADLELTSGTNQTSTKKIIIETIYNKDAPVNVLSLGSIVISDEDGGNSVNL